jgi:hypothetical protein
MNANSKTQSVCDLSSPKTQGFMPNQNLESALTYAKRGWLVIPIHTPTSDGSCSCGRPECPSKGKHPRTTNGYKDGTTDEAKIRSWWSKWPNANVGIVTGAESNLVVLDVDPRHDGDKALADLEKLHTHLPKTALVHTGGNGFHHLFLHPGFPIKNKVGVAPGLDIRGDGGLIVAAPSLHQSGNHYEWDENCRPETVELAPLPTWLLELMSSDKKKSEISKPDSAPSSGDQIPEGQRNPALFALGSSLRAKGLGDDAIYAALRVENSRLCNPPLDEAEVASIAKSVARYEQGDLPAGTTWSKIEPFNKPSLPSLPISILPGYLKDLVTTISNSTETPPELAFSLTLVVIGTAASRTYAVEVRPHYTETTNVWALCPLETGNRKSPVYRHCVEPLIDWENRKAKEYEPKIAEAKARRAAEEELIAIKKKQLARADADIDKVTEELVALGAKVPEIPRVPRILAGDITAEQLGVALYENNEKLGILSDEGGIFATMAGRYSNGIPNIDVFLSAFSGAPTRVDRRSREPVRLDLPTLSIGIAPQPSVLMDLLSTDEFRNRGLLARFIYLVPESKVGYRQATTSDVPATVKDQFRLHVHALLDQQPTYGTNGEVWPLRLRFSQAARTAWEENFNKLEIRMREGGDLESVKDWVCKLPGNTARIAGILHLVEHSGNAKPETVEVSLDTVSKAIQIAEVLVAHAKAVFHAEAINPEVQKAKRVIRWIKENKIQRFTFRDCHHALQGTFRNRAELEPVLRSLEDRYYIRMNNDRLNRAGRPKEVFEVNPAVHA